MKTIRLIIYDKEKNDISDDIKLVNGKGNPFGWSSHDLEYRGKIIGFSESGHINLIEGYSHRTEVRND